VSRRIAKDVKGTVYKVSFPTLPNRTIQPSLVDLYQKAGQHDILVMEFETNVPSWLSTLKTGIPVKFEWFQGKRTNVWYGYVTVVDSEKSPQRYQPMRVQCVGSSYVLKQSASRIFKNKTIREVAAIIAAENGLSFIGDKVPNLIRYSQLTITGESYWEWLQAHANEIGCVAFVSGTRLYFRRAQEVLDVGSSDIPVLQMWDTDIPLTDVGYDRTLLSFKVMSGEYVERTANTRAAKISSGVNPQTGKEFVAKTTQKEVGKGLRKTVSDVLFEDPLTMSVAHSREMAKSKTAGAALLSQFSLPAKALAQGDPRMQPFYPVYVEGTNVLGDGYWMISEVVHKFVITGEYKAQLLLLTDGSGPNLTTLYMTATPSFVGKVNLKKAIIDNTPKAGASLRGATALKSTTRIIKQGNQGFARTPTRWKATSKSKSEGRR
jgi:phage protein D